VPVPPPALQGSSKQVGISYEKHAIRESIVIQTDFAFGMKLAVENEGPRANGPDFSAAKQKELLGLLDRGTFKVALREEIPRNAPVMKVASF
jgi:hypothetical protein